MDVINLAFFIKLIIKILNTFYSNSMIFIFSICNYFTVPNILPRKY